MSTELIPLGVGGAVGTRLVRGTARVPSKAATKKPDFTSKAPKTTKASRLAKAVEEKKVTDLKMDIRKIETKLKTTKTNRLRTELHKKKMRLVLEEAILKTNREIAKLISTRDKIKLKIHGNNAKTFTKTRLAEYRSDINAYNRRIHTKREKMLAVRKSHRTRLAEYDRKMAILEMEERAKIAVPLKAVKKGTTQKPKQVDMGKKFQTEAAAKRAALKRGEYREVHHRDGTVSLLKVEQKVRTAQVQKQIQKIRTVRKQKPVQKQKIMSAVQMLATASVVPKMMVRPVQKQRAAVALSQKQKAEQVQRQKQRYASMQLVSPQRISTTQTGVATATAKKVKQAAKPAQKSVLHLRGKAMPPTVPPVLLPVVPLPTRKTKRETKKTGKQTVEYTSTQMLNRVATLKSLFG